MSNTTRNQSNSLPQEILKLRSQKVGLTEISKRLGCSYGYARSIIRANLVPSLRASELNPPDHQYRIIIEQLRVERELKSVESTQSMIAGRKFGNTYPQPKEFYP